MAIQFQWCHLNLNEDIVIEHAPLSLSVKKKVGEEYVEVDPSKITIKEKGKEEEVLEVIETSDFEMLPQTDVTCPQCGHGKAYFWLVQTRAGDEPETKFLKCEKCKHTWRDYHW